MNNSAATVIVPSRLPGWLRSLGLTRRLAILLALATAASVGGTYFTIAHGFTAIGQNPGQVMMLLLIDLVLLLTLVAVVLRKVYSLWVALRKGSVGSRLQTRIVAMFSLITIVPTTIISVFSAIFFNYGIQTWFNEKVSTALEESVAVAEAYLAEHKEVVRGDAMAMASDLSKQLSSSILSPAEFNQILSLQVTWRSLAEAIVFQHTAMGDRIIAHSRLSFSLAFETIPSEYIERANSGPVILPGTADDDKVRALIRLEALPDAYLLVGRFVDSKVIDHMENTQGSVNEYRRLKSQIAQMQIEFFIVYILVALLLLLVAVWYGMYFASRLVGPISNLVDAAERVRAGDFTIRVEAGPENDEVGTLGRAFNRMTSQLETQRQDLVSANLQLDERRRFTETVLGGVSAGVIALDKDKQITLHNRSAASLLLMPPEEKLVGMSCAELLPEILELLSEAEKKPDKLLQKNLTLTKNNKAITLNVRIAVERFNNMIEGFIVTFDDITELLVAQRHAAWADVARRVAHEIKNPLTPIQLSAERLKKKYLKLVDDSEADTFAKYTDTIARHVGDIRQMVDEFVSFARMPTPVFKEEDLGSLIKRTLFSEQTAHPDIQYVMELPKEPMLAVCDERQITQVLTNVMKNAAEAVEGRPSKEGQTLPPGQISVSLYDKDDRRIIEVRDNGPGFPADRINQMMEPYVTTRSRGTGLGLAIAKKTMEDHKGNLYLENNPEGGARVLLSFLKESDINAAM